MAISTNLLCTSRYFVDTTGWIQWYILLPTITLYHRYQDQRSADGARSPKNICLFNFFKKGEILLFILGVKKEERNEIQKCLSFFPFLTLNSELPHNIAFRMAKKEAFSNTYIQNTPTLLWSPGPDHAQRLLKYDRENPEFQRRLSPQILE
jgi:hypothetical protein